MPTSTESVDARVKAARKRDLHLYVRLIALAEERCPDIVEALLDRYDELGIADRFEAPR